MPERETGRLRALLTGEVVAVTGLVWATSVLLLTPGSTFSLFRPYSILLASAPMIYLPLLLMLYRAEPWARYGLSCPNLWWALLLPLLAMLLVLPAYALGFQMYRRGLLTLNMPWLVAAPFLWTDWLLQTPRAGTWLLTTLFWELGFVALPEEFFYRGYVQGRLNLLFTGRWQCLWTPVGVALPASSALFALHHFVMLPAPQALLVFFPALLFGWLRENSGSLLSPSLFHAGCNVFAILMTKTPHS